MKSFKDLQAKYSAKLHATIDSVDNEKWRAVRDTTIELVAGVAAIMELAGELIAHVIAVRTLLCPKHA